jgi:hypothetical protein
LRVNIELLNDVRLFRFCQRHSSNPFLAA